MPANDDEFRALFSAFDDVSASDELKNATLSRILAQSEETPAEEPAQAKATQIKATAGGKTTTTAKKAKWRAIRIGAIAACLVLALTGGVAYATPTSYYEVTQDGTTISLGVNCFGVTVSAKASDEEGQALIEKAGLFNIPYEESLSRAIESMEQRDPSAPVEYGPQGGEHEVLQPRNAPDEPGAQGYGEDPGMQGAPDNGGQAGGAPQGEGQPQDANQPQDQGQQQGQNQPQEAGGAPQGNSSPDGAPAGGGGAVQPNNPAPDNQQAQEQPR